MPSRTAGTATSGIAQLICSASQCPITRLNTADSAQQQHHYHDTREIPIAALFHDAKLPMGLGWLRQCSTPTLGRDWHHEDAHRLRQLARGLGRPLAVSN